METPVQTEHTSPSDGERPIYSLEIFGLNATLYLNGPLSLSRAAEVMVVCHQLPGEVRRLRIDMRGVDARDERALDHISRGLRPWRDARDGSTRVDLPAVPVSFSVLAP